MGENGHVKPGMEASLEWVVTDDLCTSRGGKLVFSTPSMVLFVERAAMHLLEPFLAQTQGSVGTRIDIRHMAPTLRGTRIRADAQVTRVDGVRLAFMVKVFDEDEQVGEAEHERAIIDVNRYLTRLEKKAKTRNEHEKSLIAEEEDWLRCSIDTDTGIAHVALNRPEKHNIINLRLRKRLADTLESLGKDGTVKVIVVRGTGPEAFSAGADVKEFGSLSPQDHADFAYWTSVPERIRQPVIAAIDGYCFGAGFETALACDFRIVTTRAQFALPEIRLGMMPGSGGGQRLLRVVGSTRAKLLCMTGARLDAQTADRWGLVTKVVEPEQLDSEVQSFAKDLAASAPLALRMVKLALNRGADCPLSSAIEMEGKMYAMLASTSDYREGVSAWQQKRRPIFQGR